jgi:ATP-dependent Clp protease ATP-binding subunit ClpC
MTTDILDKFTTHLKNTLAKAYSLAMEVASPDIHPEHLLLALLMQKGSIGGEILRKADLGVEEVRAMLHAVSRIGDGQQIVEAAAPRLSAESRRVVEKAVLCANANQHKYVGTEHLLSAILNIESPVIAAILTDQDIDIEDLDRQVNIILKSTSKFPEITETFEIGQAPTKEVPASEEKEAKKARTKRQSVVDKTPTLDFFSVDLTDPKVQQHIDPVIGREKEIERLVQILSRRTKNNPVLLGEPGVGKTAIIEGLAKRIMQGDVPDALAGKRILAVDLGLIVAGTIYRGEFEGRLKQIIDEVKANPELILFIDELHTIIGAGSTSGSMDAANILKPALARGDMRVIGATTLAEYKKHIEADGALERRFQAIAVDQPSTDVAIKILMGLKPNYEEYHNVTIDDDAIEAAVTLSHRYMPDRQLPDKAVDLIDEASACVKVAATADDKTAKIRKTEEELEEVRARKEKAVKGENFIDALELKTKEKELEHALHKLTDGKKAEKKPIGRVTRAEVAGVISRATGIPLTDLMAEEKAKLLKLEALLMARVVGQDKAVASVAEMVRRAKAGISHPDRPLASFLFLGPSGVGKTELAKALAELVFHAPNALVRIDMSEFSEGFNMSKLIGSPAGYVGYRDETKLTDVVKRRPHSLVLFDEIEKAHGDVHNLLLQILEDGHVTDATGRKIDFKNSIVVMTSNVGSNVLSDKHVGFTVGENAGPTADETKTDITAELERAFRPEFINRIDRTVIFNPLSKEVMSSIVELQLNQLSERVLRDHGIAVKASADAIMAIAEKSFNPLYGARTVRREIQEAVESPLAQALLAEKYAKGDTIAVELKDDGFVLAKNGSAKKPVAAKTRANARATAKS